MSKSPENDACCGDPDATCCAGLCHPCACTCDPRFCGGERVIPPVAPAGGEREVVHDCSLNRCCNLCGRHLTPHVMQWADPCIDPSTSPEGS